MSQAFIFKASSPNSEAIGMGIHSVKVFLSPVMWGQEEGSGGGGGLVRGRGRGLRREWGQETLLNPSAGGYQYRLSFPGA